MSTLFFNLTDKSICLIVVSRFSTSRQTLSWIPDSFFTALLSNRIASRKDENGALFIDRDPTIFSIILNYLRTRDIDLKNVDIRALRHEAEYYGITPLVKRLMLCEDLSQSPCGDVLFYGYLPPPSNILLYFFNQTFLKKCINRYVKPRTMLLMNVFFFV